MTSHRGLLLLLLSVSICFVTLWTRYEAELITGIPLSLVKTALNFGPTVMKAGKANRLSVLELLTLDASELQILLSRGNITSVSLVEQVLDQIAKEDRNGANLRAMLFVRSRKIILKDAAQLDDERRHGKLRGPFHGIPIIVKDALINSPSLGTPSTFGCYALLTSKPCKNATVVDKLIADGLIIVGKSNLNEFSNWKGFNGINGFSAIGGQTNSAYIVGGLRKHEAPMGHSSPCGSSTGSAVGVSAGYSPVAIGTETEGSLIQPAGRAALFALKPTAGSVPREGTWTLAKALGSTGAMTKSVRDLAIMTAMIHTNEVQEKLPATGYTSFLTKTFDGLKVGFADPAIWHFPPSLCPPIESNAAYFDAMSRIEKGGADVEFPISLPRPSDLTVDGVNAMSIVIFNEYQENINDYLSSLAFSEVKNLKELIDWNAKHADIELPFDYANQGILIKTLDYKINATKQEEALNRLRTVSMGKGLDPLFDDQAFDLIAVPQDSEICVLPMASGYPVATMPLGILDHLGRPFSLAVIAKAGREDLIFQFLSAFEATFPKRVVPPQLVRKDDGTKGKDKAEV